MLCRNSKGYLAKEYPTDNDFSIYNLYLVLTQNGSCLTGDDAEKRSVSLSSASKFEKVSEASCKNSISTSTCPKQMLGIT